MADFKSLESCFEKLKSGKSNASKELETELSKYFNKMISLSLTKMKSSDPLFVMTVTPEVSTIDKVLTYMTTNESKLQALCDVWHSCNNWKLSIDNRILKMLNPKELTALVLHEMHHIMESDAIPNRLVNVVQFGIADSKISQKALLKDHQIQKVLKLPIVSACQSSINKSEIRKSIKKEMRADSYAKKSGYLQPLLSAIDKLESKIKKSSVEDDDVQEAFKYSMDLLDTLEARKSNLVKDDLLSLKRNLPDSVLKESVDEIYESWFESDIGLDLMLESGDKLIKDSYFLEFGLGKRLQPIERNQIDYIAIKIQDIKTINDKMMIVSYINSKLELVDYYLGILDNPKLAKKYKVPHPYDQLITMKSTLNKLRERAINAPIYSKDRELYVRYPVDYEG